MTGPTVEDALRLHDRGLAVIPAPEDDGKSVRGVLAGFQKCRRRLPRRVTGELFRKHPGANVALLPHLCGPRLVVVDCDADEALEAALGRYGRTPLLVRTPRGVGGHLYYRAPQADVRQRNLRTSEGLAIDVKAGPGAVVIVPPSVRPSTGEPYAFARGGWDDVASLPVFPVFPPAVEERPAGMVGGRVREGSRNDHLFRELLRHAHDCCCGSFGELEAAARLINERDCEPPLPWAEVEKAARSAWAVHSRGDNWVGREPRVAVRESDHLALLDCPEAFTLWMLLRFEHQGLNAPFALSAKAMAGAGVIPGWSARKYRKARDVLLEWGFLTERHKGGRGPGDLTERHKGGRGPGDPDLFSLVDLLGGKGADWKPNTNKTPSPLAPPSLPSAAQPRRRAA